MYDLLIDAFACHRITRLVTQDHLTQDLRDKVVESLERTGHRKLAVLPMCPWCSSMWIAFGVVALRRAVPRAWSPVARALAFSTITGVIAERT